MNHKDFWTKVGWSFVRGFLAVFVPGVLGLFGALANSVQIHDTDVKTLGWLVGAVLVGAIAAGIRAIQAYFTNVEPGDEQFGPKAKQARAAEATQTVNPATKLPRPPPKSPPPPRTKKNA